MFTCLVNATGFEIFEENTCIMLLSDNSNAHESLEEYLLISWTIMDRDWIVVVSEFLSYSVLYCRSPFDYSTVTDFAKLRGKSTFTPLLTANQ